MKAARLSSKYIRQTEEKTKKRAMRRTLQKASEPLGMHRGRGQIPARGTPHLELYQKENCRFSHSVRSRLSQMGLDYITHNVPDQIILKHEQLARVGGKDEIPFLLDRKTGVKLYGSNPILSYLEKQYEVPKNTALGDWMKRISARIQSQADELAWAIKTPMDKARILMDDVADGWESLRNSYQTIRNVIRETRS